MSNHMPIKTFGILEILHSLGIMFESYLCRVLSFGMFQNVLKMTEKRYQVRFNVLSKFLFCQLFSLSQDSCLSVSENGLGQTD